MADKTERSQKKADPVCKFSGVFNLYYHEPDNTEGIEIPSFTYVCDTLEQRFFRKFQVGSENVHVKGCWVENAGLIALVNRGESPITSLYKGSSFVILLPGVPNVLTGIEVEELSFYVSEKYGTKSELHVHVLPE